jgi:hypothetical protein
MLIARWQIDARFGHKQKVIDLMKSWLKDVGAKAGTDKMDVKILTGSVGAREATVEVHHTIESLAQLEEFFAAIGKNDAHKQWGQDLEPYVVSGSARWEILRVV